MKYTGLVTVALMLVLSAPAGATVFKGVPGGPLSGNLDAVAQWNSTNGCLDRSIQVMANKNPDGLFAGINFEVWDHCNNVPVVERFGGTEVSPAEFQMDQDRTLASLHATIPTYDFLNWDPESGADPPQLPSIDVDLDWTGIGRLKPPAMIRYGVGHDDNLTIVNLDHETCRAATVSGSVVDEGDGTDYAQDPLVDNRLCQQVAGSMFLFVFVNP